MSMVESQQHVGPSKKRGKLSAKFGRVVLLLTATLAVATLSVVITQSVRSANQHLEEIRHHIENGIEKKGSVLADSHALALKNMVIDNAFSDVASLINRAVEDDEDVVYGLFVNSAGKTWAYMGPDVKRTGAPVAAPTDAPPATESPEEGANRAPAQVEADAWKRLGLHANEANVKKATLRHVRQFGEDVLEVATPVFDKDELLGTVRYGLSLSRMQKALDVAASKAKSDLIKAIAVLLILPLITIVLGLLVARRVVNRVTSPLRSLAGAANALAEGQRDIRVNITSNDEVEELGDAFNRMAQDLKTSYERLESFNRELEKKVQERTAELAGRNRDMRLVMDNVDEGFVSINRQGIMAMEHSSVMDEWFGGYTQNTSIWSYLSGAAPAFSEMLRVAWGQVVDGLLPLELCLEQLPAKLESNERTWRIRYSPLMTGEQFDGVLVVLSEITDLLAQQREEAEQREVLGVFRRLMRDRAGFLSFLHETEKLVDLMSQHATDLDMLVLKRTIHTLKGNAGLYGLEVIASLCHELESALEERPGEPLEQLASPLLSRWKELSGTIAAFAGSRDENVIEVRKSDFEVLTKAIQQHAAHSSLLSTLESWKLEPVALPLERLGEQGVALASRLGRGSIQVRIESHGLRLPAEPWAPVWSDLAHVIRNAVDHGFPVVHPYVESAVIRHSVPPHVGRPSHRPSHRVSVSPLTALAPLPKAGAELTSAQMRAAAATEIAPTISLSALRTGTDLRIEVADNGKGINWDAVAKKAANLGMPHSSREELVRALLADGVSTAEAVTEVSGRGVGMAAVKARIEAMGGRIEVNSTPGKGTTWRFIFPLQRLDESFLKL